MSLAAELTGSIAALIVIGTLGFKFVQWCTRSSSSDETNALLREIVKNTTPPGVTPPNTAALADSANDRTRRLLREAIDLQRQHREREAIDRLLTAYDMELPPRARATLHLLAGNGYARLSDYPAAEGEFREVLRIGQEANDALIQSAALGNLAALLTEKGERNLALSLPEEAIRLNKNLGNAEYLSSI